MCCANSLRASELTAVDMSCQREFEKGCLGQLAQDMGKDRVKFNVSNENLSLFSQSRAASTQLAPKKPFDQTQGQASLTT